VTYGLPTIISNCSNKEVAWRMKFIDQAAFEDLIDPEPKTEYQRYLRSLVDTSALIAR